jgi:CRP-like cAMP-binding protein
MEKLTGQLVHKVPLFFGFSPTEMKAFLDICKMGERPLGETICEFNTTSSRLFLLLDGELDILGQDGTPLAVQKPISTVGEMGFVTRKPRTATVKTRTASQILRVEHHDFDGLMESDAGLRAKIYRNLVRILSDKLSDANDLVIRYRKLYESGTRAQPKDDIPTAREADQTAKEEKPTGGEHGKVAPTDNEQEGRDAEAMLKTFYQIANLEADVATLESDRNAYFDLRKDGYTAADIEYAIKWSVRNIPNIRKFNLVKLSISEAFEDKWSM